MNIIQIYKQYPDHKACLEHLESVRWKGSPTCPYCNSTNSTPVPKESRHHCNNCNTSYSVTVSTIFHKTKVDLQKWFLAISLTLNAKKGISARQLARDIEVNKNTAWYMLMRLRTAMTEYGELLQGIIEADETYIGGKNKNKHDDKKIDGGQGRNTKAKTPVFGVLQRDGKIKAQKVKNVKGNTLKRIINQNVIKPSTVITDEWGSYNGLSKNFVHKRVNHGTGNYVVGDFHTNTIEGFWSLLKRGIVGQYYKVSDRYLNQYVNEFCFRYNNRNNPTIFELTLNKTVGV